MKNEVFSTLLPAVKCMVHFLSLLSPLSLLAPLFSHPISFRTFHHSPFTSLLSYSHSFSLVSSFLASLLSSLFFSIFTSLLKLRIHFSLLSPNIRSLHWCYRLTIFKKHMSYINISTDFLFFFLVLSLDIACVFSDCPFGFSNLRKLQEISSSPTSSPTASPTSVPTILSSSSNFPPQTSSLSTTTQTAMREEQPATSTFLDTDPLTCNNGYCMPPADDEFIGGYFYTSDGGLTTNNSNVCIDVLPLNSPKQPQNQSHAQQICLELAADRECEKKEFMNGTYCARTCGVCTQPIWSNGINGGYSGPNQLLSNGLYNSSRFFAVKIPRVRCEPYDPVEVSQAIIDWAATNPPNLDIPKMNRLAFHDAADYNKWTGTGGPDGNVVMGQEMYYGQSHNLPLRVKSSLSQFKVRCDILEHGQYLHHRQCSSVFSKFIMPIQMNLGTIWWSSVLGWY